LDADFVKAPPLEHKKGQKLLESLAASVAQAVAGSDSVFWPF